MELPSPFAPPVNTAVIPLSLIHAVKIDISTFQNMFWRCDYTDVVKIATPTSTITRDALAIGGTIFITLGLGGFPCLDCFVK